MYRRNWIYRLPCTKRYVCGGNNRDNNEQGRELILEFFGELR